MSKKIHICYIVFDLDLYKNFLGTSCRILNSYVDTIKIFYVGPESYFNWGEYLTYIDKVELYQYKGYVGNVDPILRMIFSKVDIDDWILIHDADELAEPKFLENIRSIIEDLNKINSSVGVIPIRTHEFFRNSEVKCGKILYSEPLVSTVNIDPFPTETEFYSGKNNIWFTANKLIKRTRFIQPFSAYGLHYKIQPEIKCTSKYIPYGINHFKLYREWFSSFVLCGFTNPFVHGKNVINTENESEMHFLNKFESLKLKFDIKTSNRFVEQIIGEHLPAEFTDFLLNLPVSYCHFNDAELKGYFGSLSRWVHTYGLNLVHNYNLRDFKICQSYCDYKF